jgi:transaldolase
MSNALNDLAEAGVSVWLDDLSRPLIETGSLAKLVDDGEIVGITTNPTIFAKAIGSGSGYEDQLRELALRGTAIGEILRLLTAWDVRAACDVLRPVFERTGQRDGRVSIEVDARISGEPDRTAAEARGLWWLVDRPNLFIKIPATEAALPAIESSLADGISINVTLIFSIERYKAVLESFLSGLERRKAAGGKLAGVESVASFSAALTRKRTGASRSSRPRAAAMAPRRIGVAARPPLPMRALRIRCTEDLVDSPRW